LTDSNVIAVDEDRAATRGFDLLNERVLTVAGIYGPNASGKSNVIEALAWLSLAVRRSLPTWGAATVFPHDNPSSGMHRLIASIQPK
jgi:recombinational DNA repair ATPase RecF